MAQVGSCPCCGVSAWPLLRVGGSYGIACRLPVLSASCFAVDVSSPVIQFAIFSRVSTMAATAPRTTSAAVPIFFPAVLIAIKHRCRPSNATASVRAFRVGEAVVIVVPFLGDVRDVRFHRSRIAHGVAEQA